MKRIVLLAVTAGVLLVPGVSRAETIACRSATTAVKAVTIAEDYFAVKTRFQLDRPNLQPMLETSILVPGTTPSCVVAYFSAVVRPTDNYMVFQVTVDGVPMHGHTVSYAQPDTPIVIEPEETDLNQPRMVAHQFFLRVRARHAHGQGQRGGRKQHRRAVLPNGRSAGVVTPLLVDCIN